MSKSSGLGDNFYIAEFNVSGDINSLGSISAPTGTLPSTGIDKHAMERLYAHRDGHIEGSALFNKATGQEHEALSSLLTSDRVVSYFRGTTLGNPAFSMVAKQIDDNGSRGDDGSFTFAFTAEANSFGADWGRNLTAGPRTDTVVTDGTAVDFGTGSTLFGAQAYLHVFAFTGTDCTVTIEDSTDNVSFASLAAFTQVTGVTSERIQTGRTTQVDRYVRVSTSGTFDSITFAVTFNRNDSAVSY